MTIPGPTETANGMHMGRNNLGNAPRQKIPDYNAAIIASHGQKGSVFVKGTRHGQRNAIQRAVELLWVVLSERFLIKLELFTT